MLVTSRVAAVLQASVLTYLPTLLSNPETCSTRNQQVAAHLAPEVRSQTSKCATRNWAPPALRVRSRVIRLRIRDGSSPRAGAARVTRLTGETEAMLTKTLVRTAELGLVALVRSVAEVQRSRKAEPEEPVLVAMGLPVALGPAEQRLAGVVEAGLVSMAEVVEDKDRSARTVPHAVLEAEQAQATSNQESRATASSQPTRRGIQSSL